jgi:DNA polymerase
MTREDILRELELLPMWKLNPHATLPVNQPPQQSSQPAQLAAEPLVALEVALEATTEETVHTPPSAHLETTAKLNIAWLLFCPKLPNQQDDCSVLLANIIKAMQLLQTEYVLVDNAQDLTQYQAQKTLLFGLQAANALFASQHQDIELVRGQAHAYQAGFSWATYHPMQLLQDPSLKRQAWQDICSALKHTG